MSLQKASDWKLEFGKLSVDKLHLHDKTIPVFEITKIKYLNDHGHHRHKQMIITHNNSDHVRFGADYQRELVGLPMQYIWFAKIINARMVLLGFDLKNLSILDQKMANMWKGPAYIKGCIMKKSQHVKKWEERFVVINSEGLFSFKDPSKKHSFMIKTSSVKYIYTRFEVHNKHLVVKIKHGGDKTELAIPVMDFCNKSLMNWIWAFYVMLRDANPASSGITESSFKMNGIMKAI